MVFEVPVAPKASQNRPGVASRGLVERAEVASSVFGRVASRQSGSEAAQPSAPQRTSAEISGNQPKPEESQGEKSILVALNVLDLLYPIYLSIYLSI